jgi:hypothetical protein
MNSIFTTHTTHGTSVYQIVQVTPACFYAKHLTYLPHVPYTDEELAEQAAQEAEWAEYHESTAGRDEPYEPDQWEFYGCYITATAAQRAVELHNVMSVAYDEIDAFGAPSECLADACRGPMRELDALEREFGTRHPNQRRANPYTERGVEDRTQPLWQALGLPENAKPDDHTVLAMLGERTAAWQHDAPLNPEFLGAARARAGEDY